ncbi:MAG: hypothetical protein JNM84_01525 [Planctomycetes bacterium]|nr:hypothetical protein [Planctomycetota bacterium]
MPSTTQVRLGFKVEFLESSLGSYRHMNAAAEAALRQQYFDAMVGSQRPAFEALLTSPVFQPVESTTDGFLGAERARELAVIATQSFNALQTGMLFDDPPPEPHCIQWVWIDGQWKVFYNWLLPVAACAQCPPPGAYYHVVVQTTTPFA